MTANILRLDQHESVLVGILWKIAMAIMIFQAFHFSEHFIQFGVWLLGSVDYVRTSICGRDTPWMSGPATWFVQQVGDHMLPAAPRARQMMVGMEVLHLIGNTVFLVGLGCLLVCERSWPVKAAFIIEGLHLCEHISLTYSAVYIGKPIGVSTLFGHAPEYFGREGAVGYRVGWHFVMNLFPMPFAMFGIWKHQQKVAAA